MSRTRYNRLAEALQMEAHRAQTELKTPRVPRPYFVSYLTRDVTHHWFDARFGTLYGDETRRWRRCFADVRVGSHRTDHVRDGGLSDNSSKSESYAYTMLPIGDRLDGVERALWQLTETRYREAAEDLFDKRASALHFRNPNDGFMAFERREPVIHRSLPEFPEVDRERWVRYVESVSAVGTEQEGLFVCEVELTVRHTTRVFCSTEGSVIIDRQPLWQVSVVLELVNKGGVTVPWSLSHFGVGPDELPSVATLKREIKKAIRSMRAIANAETLRAYSGPVLLDPVPAGLLMHEALGHRLEGGRLLSSGEGQTFRDALGEQLLPEAISMWDDPRLKSFEGRSLVGHYMHDDEGVPASNATLVDRGSIAGYLTSRAAVGKGHRSNGHARAEAFERPMSRMGVTVVEAQNPVPDKQLKKLLIEEVKARQLPFGIHVLAASSGETATKSYDFQAFLGQIQAAARIYPDGREELVRDVSFVGTPLIAMRGIVAAGTRREVDNGYCGAESGAVPVSTISPAFLVDDLELQSSARPPHAPHTYSLPAARKAKPRRSR